MVAATELTPGLCYVELSTTDEGDAGWILEVCRMVHGFNRTHGNLLGIDFPQMVAGQRLWQATAIRLFGTAPVLEAFMAQPRTRRLKVTGALASTPVQACPAETPLAAIRRAAAANKNSPSHARRRQRRGVGEYKGWQAAPDFVIGFTSKSNGHEFALKLRKVEVADAAAVTFTSYGTCATGGLPQF